MDESDEGLDGDAESVRHLFRGPAPRLMLDQAVTQNSGQSLEVESPDRSTTKIQYSDLGNFPWVTTDAANLSSSHIYDSATGKEISTKDPNGFTIQRRYDGLGRPTKSWYEEPDGEPTVSPFDYDHPREEYVYVDPVPESTTPVPGRIEAYTNLTWNGAAPVRGKSPSVAFYDGYSRVLGVKSYAFTAAGQETIASDVQEVNAAGQVTATALPFVASNSSLFAWGESVGSHPAAHFDYDDHGRLRRKTLPDGSQIEYRNYLPGTVVTLDANYNAGVSGRPGAVTIDVKDGLGRTIRSEVCSTAPDDSDLSHCSAGSGLRRTYFDYDALDRVVETWQAKNPSAGEGSDSAVLIRSQQFNAQNKPLVTFEADAGPTDSDGGTTYTTYDLMGRPVVVDSPGGAQTNYKYSRAGQLTKTWTRKKGNPQKIWTKYSYGKVAAEQYAAGRLKSSTTKSKDPQGHVTIVTKRLGYTSHGAVGTERVDVASNYHGTSWQEIGYRYDTLDRLVDTIYPAIDAGSTQATTQTVHTSINEYGQPVSLSVAGGGSIVENAFYSIYGNLEEVVYGNGVRDVAVYGDGNDNVRLRCLRTRRAAGALVDSPLGLSCSGWNGDDLLGLAFPDTTGSEAGYDARGHVLHIDDLSTASSTVPSNPANAADAMFAYDGLGQLVSAAYPGGNWEEFDYDDIGNLEEKRSNAPGGGTGMLTQKASYDPFVQPHRMTEFGTATIEHDAEGNRTGKGNIGYGYDVANRLVEVFEQDSNVILETNVYADSATRVVRYDSADDTVTHYHSSGLVELVAGVSTTLVRQFSFAGRIVAMDSLGTSRFWTSTPSALTTAARSKGNDAVSGPRPARTPLERRAAILDAARTASQGTLAWLAILGITALGMLLSARGRSARVAGVLAACVAFAIAPSAGVLRTVSGDTLWGVTPAHAEDPNLWYFHADQLGSIQVVTKEDGSVEDSVRYRAYGQVRCSSASGECSSDGASGPATSAPRSFTGHRRDTGAGLIYMGARSYDPELGSFLTFDPAGGGPTPYAYVLNNPLAGTDPDGENPLLIVAALFAVASFVDTLVQTGDVSAALTSAVISAAASVLTSPVGNVVTKAVTAIAGEAVALAVQAAQLGYQAYSAVQSSQDGSVLSAALSFSLVALGGYHYSREGARWAELGVRIMIK